MKTILSLLAVALLLAAPVANASELSDRFDVLAKEILKVTKSQPVTVGVFSQTGLPDSNSGPGLESELTDALKRAQVDCVQKDAKYEVKGDYAFAKSRDPSDEGLKVIKIKVRIIEKEFSEDLLTVPLQVKLDHTKSVAQVTQVTTSLPEAGSKAERNEKLDKAVENPSVHIHGATSTLISSTPQSEYDVEVLVRPKGDLNGPAVARAARVEDGKAFVDLGLGEIYELKIYNRTDQPVGVNVSIDGVDMFHFQETPSAKPGEEPRKFSRMVVQNKGHVDQDGTTYDGTSVVPGWFQKLAPPDNYLSFQIVGYGEGAVTRAGLKSRGDVGVIHLQFAKALVIPEGALPKSASNETGFGPPRSIKQKSVKMEFEPPHDFITIRYQRPEDETK